jgi:hypothetical protein
MVQQIVWFAASRPPSRPGQEARRSVALGGVATRRLTRSTCRVDERDLVKSVDLVNLLDHVESLDQHRRRDLRDQVDLGDPPAAPVPKPSRRGEQGRSTAGLAAPLGAAVRGRAALAACDTGPTTLDLPISTPPLRRRRWAMELVEAAATWSR